MKENATVGTMANNKYNGVSKDNDFLKTAINLKKQGIACIATNEHKRAISYWKNFQHELPTEEELQKQFTDPRTKGLAIICGKVSGCLEAIDVDLKYDNTGTLEQKLNKDLEEAGLKNKLKVTRTKNNGLHLIYRCNTIERNQKLAQRSATPDEIAENPNERVRVLIETRAEGGYIIAPPTEGYECLHGELQEITPEERDTLLEICRSYNTYVTEAPFERSKSVSNNYELTPWEDYNNRGDVVALLEKHGWTIIPRVSTADKITLKRPGKTDSLTSGDYCRRLNLFTVFTTSSVFEPLRGYKPAAVYTMLEHHGNFSEAAKALEALGYGKRNEKKKSKAKNDDETNLIEDLQLFLEPYGFKRNEITRYVERGGIPMQQKDFNSVYLDVKAVYPKVSYDLVDRIVNSNFTPTYNDIKEFIELHKHRTPSGSIKALFETITSDTGFDEKEFFPDYVYHFGRKWFVGIISSIYGEHSPLMLVLSGNTQGTGKTEWLRRLLPAQLKNYYGESKLDAGKDDEILMCQKLLLMNDEMGGQTKKDEKRLKELLSKQVFSLREPYGRNNVDLRRLAVLCGTTNDNEILSDPTGNRRIIPINVISIDQEAYNKIDKIDILIEAYHLYKSGFEWMLTADDVKILNRNTSGFEQTSPERELLIKNFRMPRIAEPSDFLTATEIKSTIEKRSFQKINMTRLGLELKKWGCEKVAKKINGAVVRGYNLIDREVARLSDGCYQGDNPESIDNKGF